MIPAGNDSSRNYYYVLQCLQRMLGSSLGKGEAEGGATSRRRNKKMGGAQKTGLLNGPQLTGSGRNLFGERLHSWGRGGELWGRGKGSCSRGIKRRRKGRKRARQTKRKFQVQRKKSILRVEGGTPMRRRFQQLGGSPGRIQRKDINYSRKGLRKLGNITGAKGRMESSTPSRPAIKLIESRPG